MYDRHPPVVGGRMPASADPLADDGWTPPSPSTSTRVLSLRARGSSRPTIVTPDGRCMRVESYLECGVGLALLAHPDVLHVMEQALRVVWVDDAGRRHAHWLDFVVILRDGRRIGVLVKPEALTRRSNVDVVALGIAAVGRRYGLDGVMVLTDRVVNRDRVTDARLINTARRHADPEADAALASIVATVNGPTAISVLVTRTGLGERAYRALVRSLATGNLELISSDRINADALVDRPASQGRAGA